MDLLSYVQIFVSFFCSIILSIFPGIITYKHFSLVVAIVSVIFIIKCIIRREYNTPAYIFIWGFVILFIIFDYGFVTPNMYNYQAHENRAGTYLAFIGQTAPAIVTGLLVGLDEKTQEGMRKKSLYVSIAFAIVAFFFTARPTSVIRTRYVLNTDNNLNYQSLSYMAAFSAALAEYFLLFKCDGSRRERKTITIVCVSIIVVDLATILLAGGRGGFVTFFILILLSLFLFLRYKEATKSEKKRFIWISGVFIVGFLLAFWFASNSQIATSGFDRIERFLQGAGDQNRDEFRKDALISFWEKPILGHGFGAVYYEIGFYSHNIITDLLVETGIVGTVLFLVLLGYSIYSCLGLIKRNPGDALWIFILVCGLMEFSFSGYYLASAHIWWVIAFIFSKQKNCTNCASTGERG